MVWKLIKHDETCNQIDTYLKYPFHALQQTVHWKSILHWFHGRLAILIYSSLNYFCFCWNSQNINFIQYMIASNDRKGKKYRNWLFQTWHIETEKRQSFCQKYSWNCLLHQMLQIKHHIIYVPMSKNICIVFWYNLVVISNIEEMINQIFTLYLPIWW